CKKRSARTGVSRRATWAPAHAPGRARHQLEPAHRRTAPDWVAAHAAGRQSVLRPDPGQHIAGDAWHRTCPTPPAISTVHHGDTISEQHRPLHVSFVPVAHRKALSRGLTFSAAYTFSRLIDDAGAVFDSAVLTGPVANFQAADSFNKRLEKDVSTGNVPHIFASGLVYELPYGKGRARALRGWKDAVAGGWQLASIVRFQS